MSQELVSVIMPTYNASRYLADSIESILGQTYTNLELLITDDCSSDETKRILQQFSQKDSRVKVEYLKENYGPGIARNKSIERAHGRYIAFCDCDDKWFPDKLEKQIKHMTRKDCALCSSSYLICDDNNQITGINISPKHLTLGMMKRDNKIGCLTAIYDIKRLGHKFYMPAIRKRQDWALFLNILKECQICFCLTEPLAYYRQRENSVSSNKLSLIKYNVNVYETVFGYSTIKAYLYFFTNFLPTYFIKVWKRKRDSKRYLANIKEKDTQ
ncbi:MAG: glycosyltransferase [Prevotella sp.]|jgi:glycosyltransferase involved in cell wall biosynthesis|nr:glycosyltransferase [Prevotella sp.]MBQ8714230.1 glycosyltransferase [Prevotella sp.]